MKIEMKFTVLVDNQAAEGLAAEHGLSFHLRIDGRSLLFDTGSTPAVLTANAAALGVDLAAVETLVLSHGHYDHSGGLPCLENPNMHIYAHRDVERQRFSLHPGQPPKNISMSEAARRILYQRPLEQLHMVTGPHRLLPDIWITGEIPRWYEFEDTGGPFFRDLEGRLPDTIDDDMAIWLATDGGLVVMLGCCHSGLLNTIEYIRQVSGIRQVRGVIGGLHLRQASAERLEKTIAALREWSPEFIIPCHCTGEAVVELMRAQLGDMVKTGYAGMSIRLDDEARKTEAGSIESKV